MPKIDQHHSTSTTKLLYIGDSGAGKTGSLASLAAAGYKLRILDLDNGIDILRNYVTDPTSMYVKQNPKVAENIDYITLTDKMRNVNGKLIPAQATVWQRAVNMMVEWKEKNPDGTETNLGKVVEWGPDVILVVDSLSMLATAALNYHLSMNGALAATRTQNEARRDVGAAQNILRTFLNMVFDENIKCNIIVTAHITFVSEVGGTPKIEDGTVEGVPQGYPAAVGRALSPHIPRYFNNMLIAKAIGAGAQERHRIFTRCTSVAGQIINAKSSAPLKVASEYPLETGLADYFKAVRG